MGITDLSLARINRYIQPESRILILGCQNIYSASHYGEIAQSYFIKLGHYVDSLDITGCQGSTQLDLREDLQLKHEYNLVLQHGTIEHIDGSLYQPMLNIHNALITGGIAIHENPKTGNWPKHGCHYFTQEFYSALGYEVLELCEEPAMGNTTDGWNVCAVLRKNNDEFLTEDQFNKIYEQFVRSE